MTPCDARLPSGVLMRATGRRSVSDDPAHAVTASIQRQGRLSVVR